MGRIKTKLIKRTSNKLMKLFSEKFSVDFDKNKLVLEETAEIRSKKLRNGVAGYLVRLVKRKQADPTSKH